MRTATDPIAVLGSTVRDGEALPVLRSRLDTAAALWHRAATEGVTPLVFCLGGSGGKHSELEAPVMAEQLVVLGVPRSVIIEEPYSHTTEENLLHLRAILADPGFPEAWAGRAGTNTPDARTLPCPEPPLNQSVTIVTSGFHLRRALLIARHLGLNATGVAAPTTVSEALQAFPREVGAYLLLAYRSLRRTST